MNETQLKQINDLIAKAEKSLAEVKKIMEQVSARPSGGSKFNKPRNNQDASTPTLGGIDGIFDGKNMRGVDGNNYEVPSNYAAKTKLVFGDKLKLIKEDGKDLFKLNEKVDRVVVTGFLCKKDDGWYLLTDSHTYKVLDTAVEFNSGAENDEVEALIPADNIDAPFAAIEKFLKEKPVSNTPVAVAPTTPMQQTTTPASQPATESQAIPPTATSNPNPSTTGNTLNLTQQGTYIDDDLR